MTAEIAILNKSAVALAADSAVTISVGNDQQKIFDTADKLFELTQGNAIGIMINSDMNFMETPLPVLIKLYRETAPQFGRVREAADHFLMYLSEFARASPERIRNEGIQALAVPIFRQINHRAREAILRRIFVSETSTDLRQEYKDDSALIVQHTADLLDEQIDVMERAITSLEDASFVGGEPELTHVQLALLEQTATEHIVMAGTEQRERMTRLIQTAMRKRGIPMSFTGVVVAGFGSEELFPTLISFELYGLFGERLKFAESNFVDIDRNGDGARVLPFAQREMVERFLYGLDRTIETEITRFCKFAVPQISEQVIGALDMGDADRASLSDVAKRAEENFYNGLEETSFDAIRATSRSEIEDMVEFMPKPEMARMAEALVNLTSMKRRVSRGFEPVGGPIDVAVISKAEGFVWVRRKHYFPGELNSRYFDRMREQRTTGETEEG